MILKIQACPLQDDPEEGDGVGNKSHFLVHILPKSYSQPIFFPQIQDLVPTFLCDFQSQWQRPYLPNEKFNRKIPFIPSGPSHDDFVRLNHLHIKSGYISDRLFKSGSNVEISFPVELSIFSAMMTSNINHIIITFLKCGWKQWVDYNNEKLECVTWLISFRSSCTCILALHNGAIIAPKQ